MKNTLVFSFVFLIGLFACKKEAAVDLVPHQFQKLEKIATKAGLAKMLDDASGSIGITNLKPFGSEAVVSGGGPSELIGRFFDAEGKVTFGALEVQDFKVIPGVYGYYHTSVEDSPTLQNYFGDIQPVKLHLSEQSTAYLLQEEIYIPQELFVHDPIQRGTDRISQTYTINWNSDPQNVNGVFILIDFLPEVGENEGRFETTFASHKKLIYTEDDGAYQLQPNDFNQIPSGAHVSFVVGRGDYLEATGSDQKSYIIYSYTGAVGMFYVDAEEN